MDDAQIVQLYWDRNEKAINATSDKYGNYCTSIAKNILGNQEDAEECVNDTYLNAWNAMPPHKPNILSTFLGKITRNISFNRYKHNSADKRGGGELSLIHICAMAEYIEKNAFPAATARVLFEGHLAPMKFTYEDYQANRLALQAKHGKEIKLWLEPADSAALDTLLQNVRRSRQNFAPGVFEDHLDKMIAAEKRSVTHFLKEAAANAPHPALNKKTKEHPQR